MTTEQALVFDCSGDSLVGVLSLPAGTPQVGVIVVVGGPQYRAGSHRQFVLLARALAAAGHAALRFDYRGMGDSDGAQRSFEQVSDDIGAAIDAFRHALPGLERIVLWGLCDGASAALLYLNNRPDRRVAGLCLLNPWLRSATSQAKAQVKHYYRRRLLQRGFWVKLLRGEVTLGALSDLWSRLRTAYSLTSVALDTHACFQHRMALAWAEMRIPALLLMSGEDHVAHEFDEYTATDPDWQRALRAQPPTRANIAGADHTLSHPAHRIAAERATVAWLGHLVARG